MRVHEREPRRVTVFGAGISGLTAAHELATRGFEVQVIDPDVNEERHAHTLDRGIGGMARSQWAIAPSAGLGGDGLERLWAGEDLLLDQAIAFGPEADAHGRARPVDPARAARLLDRFVRARDELAAHGQPRETIAIRVPDGPGAAEQVAYLRHELGARGVAALDDVILPWPHPIDPRCVYFAPAGAIVPGEHGFRFFPSFYRHLFDTMRRTRILRPRPSERTKATVFDNLVPSTGLGFARDGDAHSFMIPRRAMLSFEAVRKIVTEMLSELEYSLEDIAQFELKLFKYMTTSSERRRREYEHVSWGAFLDTRRFSRVSREHIEFGPQMSAALRGSQSDARTQGNISVQLFLDQLRPNALADYTLAGPTSSAWLDHWHDFLLEQGVTFARGRLVGFDAVDGEVVPRVEGATVTGAYFVIALSLPAIAALAGSFVAAGRQAGLPDEALRDLHRVRAFAGDLATDLGQACPRGPLQHLSGIQFYFADDVRFWRGHTQYLDSAWGLTSIAQPQFWSRERTPGDQYRSILSIDIGIFDREFEGRTAWECTAPELAERVWTQIRQHHEAAFRQKYGPSAVFPTPVAYALDAQLELEGRDGRIRWNHAPFLVNRTSQYETRPGRIATEKGESRAVSHYDVIAGRYVLAGTFMQTYTRLTSMEGANESARHAVNALLQRWNAPGDRCEIWDPEEHEVEDLAWLKELDEALVRKRLPHFIDILGWTELPRQLVPQSLRALGERLVRGRSSR